MKFRKKPIVIEAMQWTGENAAELWEFNPKMEFEWIPMMPPVRPEATHNAKIKTLEGVMTAMVGDWIIKGVAGEFYLCKPEIFAATYEAC